MLLLLLVGDGPSGLSATPTRGLKGHVMSCLVYAANNALSRTPALLMYTSDLLDVGSGRIISHLASSARCGKGDARAASPRYLHEPTLHGPLRILKP